MKIAQAAVKAQRRIDEHGGLPDIHVPGMENSAGGGGNVSAETYIREAMSMSPNQSPKPPIEVGTGQAAVAVPAPSVVERTRESLGVTIGGSYGKGHTARVIRRVMESESKRVADGSGRLMQPAVAPAAAPIEEGNRPGLDVNGAMTELRSKDHAQIEYETALQWAARAVAAFTLSVQSPDRVAQVMRFSEGDDYANEAREHASQVGDNGKLLRFIDGQIEQTRESALANAIRPDHQR
jgi:hypothetical protein